MARKSTYEKHLEAKRIDNYNKHNAWGDVRFRQGKSVISKIDITGSTVSTVVKFKRNGVPMSEIQTREIRYNERPDNPPYWLRPEGPKKDDGKRFKIGHVYEVTTYNGRKDRYMVLKRDDKNHMLTIAEYYGVNKLSDNKIRRKIEYVESFANGRFERVAIDKGTFSQMTRCWTGGCQMSSLDEVGRK